MRATDAEHGGPNGRDSDGTPHLAMAARLWPTATADDAKGSTYTYSSGNHDRPALKLPGAVKLWPTPKERDWKGQTQRGIHAPGDGLPNAVKMWPTPASQATGGVHGLGGGSGNTAKLRALVGEEEGRKMASGALNPDWVEKLMNFPVGWTDVGMVTGKVIPRASRKVSRTESTALDASETPLSHRSHTKS